MANFCDHSGLSTGVGVKVQSVLPVPTVFIYHAFPTVPNFLTEQSAGHQAPGGHAAASFLKDRICELVQNSFTGSKLMHRDELMDQRPTLCQQLARGHTAVSVQSSVDQAHSAGFKNIVNT